MGFIGTDRNQIQLFAYSLADFLPKDAKARFVAEIVQSLDLSKLYSTYSHLGTNAIDPSLLLATWFLAYSEGIFSSRKLEQQCKDSLQFIYISGHSQPDHTTLSRFRKTHLKLLEDYFKQIVLSIQERHLSDFTSIYIDGTKIQAVSSKKHSRDDDQLSRYISRIQEQITEYMHQCDTYDETETQENDALEEIRKKIDKLKALEATLIERQQQLRERKQTLKTEHRKKHQINIKEPDARMMNKVNGQQSLPAYNAQAAVEEKHQIIVATDVVTDASDHKQCGNQIDNVIATAGDDPERQYTVDAGYFSKDQLAECEARKLDVLIADPLPEHRSIKTEPTPVEDIQEQKRPVTRADFVYHPDEDVYECPHGKKLTLKGSRSNHGKKIRVYETTQCVGCPIADFCPGKKKQAYTKRIHRSEDEALAEAMLRKLRSAEGVERMRKRKTTVEPVFGYIKEQLGFRRFHLRGHDAVRAEWALVCLAHNINKLYRLKRAKSTPDEPFRCLLFWFLCNFLARLMIFRTNLWTTTSIIKTIHSDH